MEWICQEESSIFARLDTCEASDDSVKRWLLVLRHYVFSNDSKSSLLPQEVSNLTSSRILIIALDEEITFFHAVCYLDELSWNSSVKGCRKEKGRMQSHLCCLVTTSSGIPMHENLSLVSILWGNLFWVYHPHFMAQEIPFFDALLTCEKAIRE